jgi:hypothetical protein
MTLVILVAVAVASAAGAADAASWQRVLAYGVDVPKLGRIMVPSSNHTDDRVCIGEDGTFVTMSVAETRAQGLVCIDEDGPRAIVRAGDAAPEGGFFSTFYQCQIVRPHEVLFTAHRRFELNGTAGEYAVYRAGPAGIERVIGVAELSSDVFGELSYFPEIRFAANETGQLALRLSTAVSRLFLLSSDGAPERIAAEMLSFGEFALTARGDVVMTGELPDNRQGLVVWRDGAAQVLGRAGDSGSLGKPYSSFWMRHTQGDAVMIAAADDNTHTQDRYLYDAASGSVRPVMAGDPALAVMDNASRIAAELDVANGDNEDVVLLAYNQRGHVLISSEDPGSGDLLLAGPPLDSRGCPPNQHLSVAVPILPTPAPTATRIPTPTRIPVDPIDLEVEVDDGHPGERVDLRVVLHTNGGSVAGVQIDIHATPPLALVAKANGGPDCTHNPETGKDYTVYSFPPLEQPDDPSEGRKMRALVLSLTDVSPIADGLVLFTCRLDIAADAMAGSYQLTLSRLGGATPAGNEVDAIARGGEVIVTDRSVRALQPVGDGSAPAASACNVAAGSGSGAAWFVLLPVAILALRRARPRCCRYVNRSSKNVRNGGRSSATPPS